MKPWKLVYAVTAGPSCLWCEIDHYPASDRNVCRPFAGREVDEVDAIYRAVQSVPAWPRGAAAIQDKVNSVLANRILPWGRAKARQLVPEECEVPVEELEPQVEKYKAEFTIRLDIPAYTLYVSAGSSLTARDAALPLDMDEGLYQAAIRCAKHIGFALGTKEETLERVFLSPWKKVEECLESPDPAGELSRAAAGDVLAGKVWVDTQDQFDQQAGDSYGGWTDIRAPGNRKRALGIHVPGAFGEGTDMPLHFCMLPDRVLLYLPGFVFNFEPSQKRTVPADQVQVHSQWTDRRALVELASQINQAGREAMDALRALTKLLYLNFQIREYASSSPSAAAILGWYCKEILDGAKRAGEYVLTDKVPAFRWTWEGVARMMETSLSGGAVTALTGRRGPAPGRDVLYNSALNGWTYASYSSLRQSLESLLRECVANQRKGWYHLTKVLDASYRGIYSIGQTAYLLDPAGLTQVFVSKVKLADNRFCVSLPARGGESVPIAELEDRGIYLHMNLLRAGLGAGGMGRALLNVSYLLETEQDFMSEKVLDTIRRVREDKAQVEALKRMTCPLQWTYIAAEFADGAVGIACGPQEPGEALEKTGERLYKQAASEPSDRALALL